MTFRRERSFEQLGKRFSGSRARTFGSLALVALGVGAAVAPCEAATKTWSAFPVSSQWSEAQNWEPDVPPNPGDDLVFDISYFDEPMVNDLAPGTSIHKITFDSNGYALVGNSLLLGSMGCTHGGAQVDNTIQVAIVASGPLRLNAAEGCSLTFQGEISGPGYPVAGGIGAVILSGTQTYTGPTSTAPTGGSLIVDGTLAGTSAVDIRAAVGTSTLGGSGAFSAPLTAGSSSLAAHVVVAPGQPDSTGILHTGNATFGLNATLAVRLNGGTEGSGYDQLRVGGAVDLGASATLDLKSLGFLPAVGTAFTILKNDGGAPIQGAFVGLPEGALFVSHATTFRITYQGGEGHDVVLVVVPTVATPASLAVDPDGNGVLEAGESATLRPTWTNTSGDSLHLTGASANFQGPGPASYQNPDAGADYGTVADGASASCTDCYAIRVDATPRPARHWDATIDETVSPSFLTKTWTLHVGGSFADVPASHEFYAFIENLFHNGVTAGCGDIDYCPGDPVTRAQMAVFLLKGEHDASYVPPACSSTLFADEPCPGGPFVDWVNQLFSEGITAGCGGEDYCPNDSITRGQMAVFLLKGEHGGACVPPACVETLFTDVPCPDAPFVDWINQLVAEGVTAGCGGGEFCPNEPVDRGQMAVFLVKTFGLVLYGL